MRWPASFKEMAQAVLTDATQRKLNLDSLCKQVQPVVPHHPKNKRIDFIAQTVMRVLRKEINLSGLNKRVAS